MAASPKPTILIVPGAWQLSSVFGPFVAQLQKAGYDSAAVRLPSTGGTALPLTGLREDAAAVRAALEPLVAAGKDVVLLAHSSGGVSASAALRGLDAGARRAAGLRGGVARIIYMAAFVVPKGSSLMELLGGQPLPWMQVEGDRCTANTAMVAQVAFGDAAPANAQVWVQGLTHTAAVLFGGKSEDEPWTEGVPCAYIFTRLDGALPLPLQQQMARQLGPNAPTAQVEAGHCPFLTVPDQLLAAVEKIVAA